MKAPKLILLISLLLLSFQLFAKLAYLPLVQNDYDSHPHYPKRTEILVLDLESGHVLRKNDTGYEVGPIFVSSDSSKVYAANVNVSRIIRIDAKSLEIEKVWDNLPISPGHVFLNSTDDKLYFTSEYGGDLYVLNLTNNQQSIVLSGLNIDRPILFSKNHNRIAIYDDAVQGRFEVYDLSDWSLVSVFDVVDHYKSILSSDGSMIFLFDNNSGYVVAYDVVSGQILWQFQQVGDTYLIPVMMVGDELLLAGLNGIYMVDALTGVGTKTSDDTYYDPYVHDHVFQSVNEDSFVAINRPSVGCITGSCSVGGQLRATIMNREGIVADYSPWADEQWPYQFSAGTSVKGRFIGEKLYAIPMVPVADKWVWPLLTLSMFAMALWVFRRNVSSSLIVSTDL